MCKKIIKPREAIQLYIYSEAKSSEDIKNKLYGKRNSKLPKLLKELRDKKEIELIIGKDARYHLYKTRPESILNYISKQLEKISYELNNKEYELTTEEKTKVLKYLKGPHFKDFVNMFSSHMDVKNECYTFSGLMQWHAMSCLREALIYEFLKEKGIAKPLDLERPDPEGILDLVKLDRDIIAKFSNIHPLSRQLLLSYQSIIRTVDNFYLKIIKQLNEKIKGVNGFRG